MAPYYDYQVGRFEPPQPLDDRQTLIARARRARAEAMADVFGALYTGLKTTARAVAGFVRCAGAGAALAPPRGDVGYHGPARLTRGCN